MRPVRSRDSLFIVIRVISNERPPWAGLGYINQAQLEAGRSSQPHLDLPFKFRVVVCVHILFLTIVN